MTSKEIEAHVDQYQLEKRIVKVDFSDEKIEKALFLDIDGVIQPFSEKRFDYVENKESMDALYKSLEEQFGVDYRQFGKYDLTAAYYDWDKDAVEEIRRILDVTGAKIVVSSDWRDLYNQFALPYFFLIYDLMKYLYGYLPIYYDTNYASHRVGYEHFKTDRGRDIIKYLKVHPHIKKWVAIDDYRDMIYDIPDNFVHTYPKVTKDEADRCIQILGEK